jgi:hypothetical protein
MAEDPKTYHRSAKELRAEMENQARLIADLASWSELPMNPVHWYVQALPKRVNHAIGFRDERAL